MEDAASSTGEQQERTSQDHDAQDKMTDPPASWVNALGMSFVILTILAISHLPDVHTRQSILTVVVPAILAAVPGLFYLRFVQYRGPAVWHEYAYNLHRLGVDEKENLPRTCDRLQSHVDHTPENGKGPQIVDDTQEMQSIYIAKFEAHYGHGNRKRWQYGNKDSSGDRRDSSGKQGQGGFRRAVEQLNALVPVLVATAVITIGWAIVFAAPFPPSGARFLDMLRFGFLGAYIFVVQFLIRRFFQNDLKATAYWTAMERLVIVPIIVVVLYVVMGPTRTEPERMDLTLAFLTGIFPVVGFRTINSVVAAIGKQAIPTLEPSYPLSDLDGMNIWYEARLLEEGIEDMQSLVTANIVDVMLQTRIPVGRLVDWLDQAHLYLHMAALPRAGILPIPFRPGKKLRRERERSDRLKLRRFGIRCATDLEDVLDRCRKGAWNDDYCKGMEQLLSREGEPSVTRTIRTCLKREPTLEYVRNWKKATVLKKNGSSPAASDEADVA
jgi:hypothetical protein